MDILIVGGGLTGCTLALRLHQAGFAVALVDEGVTSEEGVTSDSTYKFDGRALALSPSSFRLWQALGLKTEAQPILRMEITDTPLPGASISQSLSPDLRIKMEDLQTDGARPSDGALAFMLENQLMSLDLEKAIETAAIPWFRNSQISGFESKIGHGEIQCLDGKTLKAPLIISAEGRHSRLRKIAGIGVHFRDYRKTALVTGLGLHTPHKSTAWQRFSRTGPLALLPLAGQRATIVWTQEARTASLLQSMPEPLFLEFFLRRFGEDLGRPDLISDRLCFPLNLQVAEETVKERLVFIGDAAHGLHPLAGQGLNLAFKDIAALTETLIKARQRGEDIGSVCVLERYARWRRFDVATTTFGSDVLSDVFSWDSGLVRLLRRSGLALIDVTPSIRHILAGEACGLWDDAPEIERT